MTEKAKAARNAYAREYYKKNKDRIKAYNNARWEKKADEMAARGELPQTTVSKNGEKA